MVEPSADGRGDVDILALDIALVLGRLLVGAGRHRQKREKGCDSGTGLGFEAHGSFAMLPKAPLIQLRPLEEAAFLASHALPLAPFMNIEQARFNMVEQQIRTWE